jgi:ABC-type nitrate/sulfonate/bicarbonate transport system substrate-binding protein
MSVGKSHAVSAFATAVLAMCVSQGASAADKITVGRISPTATSWPEYAGLKRGFFAENGIEIDPVQIGVAEGAQALSAGSLNIMHEPCNSLITFIEKGGKNVVIFFVTVTPHPGVIVGGKANTKIDDLKGKTLAVTYINAGSTAMFRRVLEQKGLRKSDYELVAGTGTANLYNGLKVGAYQAVWLMPPQSLAANEDGFHILASFGEIAPDVPYNCLGANKAWYDANPQLVQRFQDAWLKSTAWLYDSKNKREAAQALADVSRLKLEVAERTYDEMIEKVKAFPTDGKADFAGFQKMIELMIEGGELQTAPKVDIRAYLGASVRGLKQ